MNSKENELLSDDEDLPDLFAGNNDTSTDNFEIAQHDIVWAEFRNLYWPALVRCVMKKERKASVWYLDSPGKCFKVPFKKIKSFSDPQMTALIRGEIENSPMKAVHKRVWMNAITYIRRKIQGHADDPASFFDLNFHYLAYKDKVFDHHSSGEIVKPVATLNQESVAASSDEESLLSDDGEENVISKRLSVFNNLDESHEDDPKVNDIVKCIAAGYVDKHLLQVKSKKVPSSYLELYENALKSNKKKLMLLAPSSHVKNTAKLKEIAVYLMNYYEKAVEGGKCEMVNYVMYVWVPEAIDKAVELIGNGSLNLNEAIPETRRKLFPTDRLVNEEESVPFQNDILTQTKGKKRAVSKKIKVTKPKKVKISRPSSKKDVSKSPYKLPIVSLDEESKVPVKSSNIKKSKLPMKSPNKKEYRLGVRSSPRKKV